jgi:preprotein translocase subunit SecE
MGDKIKLTMSVAVLAAAIVAFYFFAEQYSLLIRVVGLLAAVAVAVAIALQSEIGKASWVFFKEARTEVRKVVWPTRRETGQTTLIIMIGVLIVGIFLWLLDMGLLWAVELLTGQGE